MVLKQFRLLIILFYSLFTSQTLSDKMRLMPVTTDLSKIKGVNFFSEVKSELSKVVWPSKQETIRLTGIVIVISLTVGLFTGGLDYILTILTSILIK